jgi:hypothetical protein
MPDPIADLEPEWREMAATEEAQAAAELPERVPFHKMWLNHMRQVVDGEVPPDHRNPAYGGKQ